MDWKRASTILIIAFVILNVFLFISSFNNSNSEYDVMKDIEFVEKVKSMLNEKNITINANIPSEAVVLPVLETEYELIQINKELLYNYLGERIEPVQDVNIYKNAKGETLEIKDGKKLRYTVREKRNSEKLSGEKVERLISDFLEAKNLKISNFTENYRYMDSNVLLVTYTQKYNNFSIDNSYMRFYIDSVGIYEFEMQNTSNVKEILGKVRMIPSIEALLRLLTYEDVKNKEIAKIEITYYSVEDENWKFVVRINSDPTWKVIFSDGTQKYLNSIY